MKTQEKAKKRNKVDVALILPCLLIVVLVGLAVAGISIGIVNGKNVLQDLDYTEYTDGIILNPDQGFYHLAYVRMYRDGTIRASNSFNADTQVFHFMVEISDMSGKVNGDKDCEIPQSSLDALADLIEQYKIRNKNIVIRFIYDKDNGGHNDMDAEIDTVVTHIKQLSAVLNKYPTTITAIEAGLVGANGEMHSGIHANAEHRNIIVDTWLKNTKEIPVLVRTPRMIYDYIGITIDDLPNATIPDYAYRLGLFNDGYLGSGNDLGTYVNRELEVEFMSKHNEHLPYGGEVTIPDSTWHDIDKCLPEMFKMNLSFLNYEWNTYVVQTKWKETFYTSDCGNDKLWYGRTAFDYIANHFGYRLVLRSSTLGYSSASDKMTINLSIDNVGFGEFYRTKNLTLYLVDSEGNVSSANIGTYSGGSISLQVAKLKSKLGVSAGEYTVYLGINTLDNGETTYPVRFANDLWSDELAANRIGKVKIK